MPRIPPQRVRPLRRAPSFLPWSTAALSVRLADANRGRLHLPPFMLQGSGFTSYKVVPTSPASSSTPIWGTRSHAPPSGYKRDIGHEEGRNRPRPEDAPQQLWGPQSHEPEAPPPGPVAGLLADPRCQGGGKGPPKQPELLSMLTPKRPLCKVGSGVSALSFPKKSASLMPRDRSWASEVWALIHSTGVPTPARRIPLSKSICLPRGGLSGRA